MASRILNAVNSLSGNVSSVSGNVSTISTNVSTLQTNLAPLKPFGFKADYITSVQSSVPTWEWDSRVQLAKSSRFLVAYGSKEGLQVSTCQANHLSCRIPTGYYSDGTFKYTVNPSAYDSSGYVSWNGTISGANGTRDLRDLDINNLNQWILATPIGCFLEETTASSLVRINLNGFTTTANITITDPSKIDFILPQQQYFKTNGYTVATALATIHKPLYKNDPRCNSVLHLHGFAEPLSYLNKGMYPLSMIESMFMTNMDYYEWAGLSNAEIVPDGSMDRLVFKNYKNYIDECKRINVIPRIDLAAQDVIAGQPSPNVGNALSTPNWESKYFLMLKCHGINVFYHRPDLIGDIGLFCMKIMFDFQIQRQNINDFFINGNITGPYGDSCPRFKSPEALSYLDSAGNSLPLRQATIDVSGGRPTARDASGNYTTFDYTSGQITYDGTIHSFLRAEQLDRWYKGDVLDISPSDPSWYDFWTFDRADTATRKIYNDLIAVNGYNFLTTNYTRLFADAWSNPFVRNSVDNPLLIANNLALKGMGGDALKFYLPGYDL